MDGGPRLARNAETGLLVHGVAARHARAYADPRPSGKRTAFPRLVRPISATTGDLRACSRAFAVVQPLAVIEPLRPVGGRMAD